MGDQRKRAGVRAISDTSIQIDFTYKGQRCRERIKLQPTPANLKRATQHRAAILDAIERGTFDYATTFPDSPRRLMFAAHQGEGILLEQWLETWLQRQQAHLKSSTLDDYRKIIYNTINPHLGRFVLTDINRRIVRADLCEKIDASNKRLANVQSVLRAALQAALDDDLIETNPLYGWKFARKDAPRKADDVDPFDSAEQAAILAAAASEPQHHNLFKFAFWTGLRTSELVGLIWQDIDWLRGTVRVQRAKTTAASEAETTKTRRGTRDVKLLAPALEALQAQKAHTWLAGKEIFINPRTGEPWAGDQPIRKGAWEPILKRAGVRYRRPYQTRHTYASMMLTAGESTTWLAGQMGHSDTTMIYKVYGRWIPAAVPDAGNKAVEMFAEKAAEKLPKQRHSAP